MAGGVRRAGRRAGRGGAEEGAHDQDDVPLSACLTHPGFRVLAGVLFIYTYVYI